MPVSWKAFCKSISAQPGPRLRPTTRIRKKMEEIGERQTEEVHELSLKNEDHRQADWLQD